MPFIGKTVLGMVENLAASGEEVEMDVSEWFQTVTEDAITRTAFGSRCYEELKAIFHLQTQQMVFAAEAFRKVFIPGYRNTNSWRLEKEIRRSLIRLIGQRKERAGEEKPDGGNPKDLLSVMIDASTMAAPRTSTITLRDIVEECKTFFFAGKQTTSNLLTWATVCLAMHPEWQGRARDEVLRVCGAGDVPSRDHLVKLKTVHTRSSAHFLRPLSKRLSQRVGFASQMGMILNETLRLYPPAVGTMRRAKADTELGGRRIPRGTELLIPIIAVHHDASLWGPDVTQFNPARFADGASRAARHPAAFLPFGLGARRCIGQNLALLEAKLTLAVILQRFTLRVAPSYVHAPTALMLLQPQQGAPIVFRSLARPSDPSTSMAAQNDRCS
ncbi:hypothetical protein BHM03_00046789 [Ensete ventricosum]|uniref:Cytochrome P450 n=1 Tax=Ensete ventricosum TaxID=4639 RepID=A0A445ML16_ENSVE|nr:hypothetical protein BHM03_00046789 [Ensete ventricosum]